MSITLEYARAATRREPWGPLSIWPSRKTLLLLALTLLAAWWVWARHTPWIRIGQVPAECDTAPLFTPAGDLVVFDQFGGVAVYDPATLTLRTRILPFPTGLGQTRKSDSFSVIRSAEGIKVIVLEKGCATVARIDLAQRTSEEFRGPLGLGAGLVHAAPENGLIITDQEGVNSAFQPFGPRTLMVWDVTRPPEPRPSSTRPRGGWAPPCRAMGTLPFPDVAQFSPGATRIVQWRTKPRGGVVLIDAKTLDVLWKEEGNFEVRGARFLDADTLCVAKFTWRSANFSDESYAPQGGDDVLELRSAADGRLLQSVTIPDTPQPNTAIWYAFSADRSVVAAVMPAYERIFLVPRTETRSVPAGTLLSTRTLLDWEILFLGKSRRWVGTEIETGSLAIMEPGYSRPLAVLTKNASLYRVQSTESPNGQQLVVKGSSGGGRIAQVFRRAGWDCRESSLGILGMPHVWLLIFLTSAAGRFWWKDGRRRTGEANQRDRWCSGILVTGAVIASLHWFLSTAVGRGYWSPAPIFLLGGLGLASGSRGWRMLNMLILCAAVAAGAAWILQLRAEIRPQASAWIILDRYWNMPRLAAVWGAGLLAGICLILLIALAGRRSTRIVEAARASVEQ